MFNKKIVLGLILLLFLTCGAVSAFDLFGDGLENDDIYIEQLKTYVTNYSDDIRESYVYSVKFDLKNVSSSLVGSELITSFYSDDKLITTNETYNNNTTVIGEHSYIDEFKHVYGYSKLWTEEYINITHCNLVIIKDGKVVFNETQPFNSDDVEDDIFKSSDEDTKQDTSSNNVDTTYVASSNSNIFHEPSCSQAHRINDANKITFSSRDEAITSGYEPCEICYP